MPSICGQGAYLGHDLRDGIHGDDSVLAALALSER
jgi:hypothetical protein